MIYYHTLAQVGGGMVIWSQAKTLREAGQRLAKNNKTWPRSSCDGQTITVGKRQRGSRDIIPTRLYRLDGDKLRLQHILNLEADQ